LVLSVDPPSLERFTSDDLPGRTGSKPPRSASADDPDPTPPSPAEDVAVTTPAGGQAAAWYVASQGVVPGQAWDRGGRAIRDTGGEIPVPYIDRFGFPDKPAFGAAEIRRWIGRRRTDLVTPRGLTPPSCDKEV
jgi:hypothetical protein